MKNSDLDPGGGFLKAAETLRGHAKSAEDPSVQADYLKAAEIFEEIHAKSRRVFAEAAETIDKNRAFAESVSRKRFTHRTWEFWLVLGVIALLLWLA
jgi:hypothetical protein